MMGLISGLLARVTGAFLILYTPDYFFTESDPQRHDLCLSI